MAAPSFASRRSLHLLRAYGVTIRVLLSLGAFHLAGRLMGPEWLAHHRPKKHVANARRIKRAILALNGLFIKVGQLISILSNFLPQEFRKEFEDLQDRIPERPFEEMATRIEDELGKSPEQLFRSLERRPIASASLAQVHKAVLFDGRTVAVKIQYLDIEEKARLDLRAIQRIFAFVGFILRIRGLSTNFVQIRKMILDELDFRDEATHMEAIAANLADQPDVVVPNVVHEFSSGRVLTTEFMHGTKVTDLGSLESLGIDTPQLAERIVTAYCRMIFNDGFYHADPHPGNILVRSDGVLVFLDFGAVARLSLEMKDGLPRFLEAILRRDRDKIIDALRRMGFIPYEGQGYNVEQIISCLYEALLEQVSLESLRLEDVQVNARMKMDMMADIRRLGISFRDLTATFQVPKDWILLERTLLLLLGVCTHVDPKMNPMKTIRPYLEKVVLGQEKDWRQLVADVVKDMALATITIPQDLKGFLEKAYRGELEVRVQGLRESADLLYVLGHQLIYTLFAISTAILAYLAHDGGNAAVADMAAGLAGLFLVLQAGSIFSARRLRRRSRAVRGHHFRGRTTSVGR